MTGNLSTTNFAIPNDKTHDTPTQCPLYLTDVYGVFDE
jgi:hypothetical protein